MAQIKADNETVPETHNWSEAETRDRIIDLDLHLLELAGAQLQKWRRAGMPTIRVTVNVSSRHFASLEFVDFMKEIYTQYHLPNETLCL